MPVELERCAIVFWHVARGGLLYLLYWFLSHASNTPLTRLQAEQQREACCTCFPGTKARVTSAAENRSTMADVKSGREAGWREDACVRLVAPSSILMRNLRD
jgi:hypothetical protein